MTPIPKTYTTPSFEGSAGQEQDSEVTTNLYFINKQSFNVSNMKDNVF